MQAYCVYLFISPLPDAVAVRASSFQNGVSRSPFVPSSPPPPSFAFSRGPAAQPGRRPTASVRLGLGPPLTHSLSPLTLTHRRARALARSLPPSPSPLPRSLALCVRPPTARLLEPPTAAAARALSLSLSLSLASDLRRLPAVSPPPRSRRRSYYPAAIFIT